MTAPAPLVVIPARMASNRLPGKPLADIHGKPMIVHVLERALESGAGKVAVACAEAEVAAAVEAAGGLAVMTDPDLPSGSDRVHAALKSLDPDGARFDVVINLQGDLPTLEPSILAFLAQAAMERTADIVTLGVRSVLPARSISAVPPFPGMVAMQAFRFITISASTPSNAPPWSAL